LCSDGWMGSNCSLRYLFSIWFDDIVYFAHCCWLHIIGDVCELLSCPGTSLPCNGNDQCVDISTLATINGDAARFTYGLTPNNPLLGMLIR